MNDIQTLSAPAKIILLGEHAVVYNQPAIAIPVSQIRAYATTKVSEQFSIVAQNTGEHFDLQTLNNQIDNALSSIVRNTLEQLNKPAPNVTISITSDIPVASGLGSGAAVSTVICKSIALAYETELPLETINELVYQVEKIHHGTPSGIDNTVIVYEKPVFYKRSEPLNLFEVEHHFEFLIADTGDKALTHISVGDVRKLYVSNKEKYGEIFSKIGELVLFGRKALLSGNRMLLGTLLNQNQDLLRQLTVSSERLDQLVDSALNAGALGAKLSGGGRGGNMIALVDHASREDVHHALVAAGAKNVISFSLPPENKGI